MPTQAPQSTPNTADAELYPLQELAAGSFIYLVENALALDDCQSIIDRFEAKPEQHASGRIGEQAASAPEIKKSTDLYLSGRADWQDIDQLLANSLAKALASMAFLHPFFKANAFTDNGYNLQRSQVGDYYHWHVDYGPGKQLSQRALVAIWYLNDVPGPGGSTDFIHQNLAISPEAGRLLLFPPYWTHVHRNAELKQGVKYIATTWLSLR